MNEEDFARIETQLGIRLPAEYRRVMASEGPVLVSLTLDLTQEIDYLEMVYLDVEHVIDFNQSNRLPDYGTAEAFPDWWQTFFLAGTNGGGDYYSLRLDGSPGVWMIGSDCGEDPELTHDSFAELAAEMQEEFREEMRHPERAIAIPTIGEYDWRDLKQALPGMTDLGDAYRPLYERQQERFAQAEADGWNAMRVFVRADEFLAWCEARQLPGDAASRELYAAERWPIENPWIGKYQAALRKSQADAERGVAT